MKKTLFALLFAFGFLVPFLLASGPPAIPLPGLVSDGSLGVTVTGRVTSANLTVSTEAKVPNGANPTTDAAGEIAVDTSTGAGQGVRVYAAVAAQLPLYQTFCYRFPAAVTATSDQTFWRTPVAITVRAVHVVQVGATNVIGQLDEYDANGANPAVVDSADITATTTNANDDGTLSNASIDAGDYVGWHTTSVSGTNTWCQVCFEYTVDQVN